MNGIELKIAREGLNLSQTELAELLGVQYRTVLRWENEEFNIPQKHEEKINCYYDQIARTLKNFENFVKSQNLSNDDEIVLVAYDKNTYDGEFEHYKLHNKLLELCKFVSKQPVRVVKFVKEDYQKFLKERNLKDNQQNRALWGSLKV